MLGGSHGLPGVLSFSVENLKFHSPVSNGILSAMPDIKDKIRALADRYAAELKRSIDARVVEMEQDDRSHVLIYQVLGVSETEGKLIDVYQNKDRWRPHHQGTHPDAGYQ